MITKKFVCVSGLACTLAALSLPAQAERSGYSYLGVGFEYVTYSENDVGVSAGFDTDADGVADTTVPFTVGLDYSGANLSQRAGAYVAIDENWGFYINNSSTLGSQSHTEEWSIQSGSALRAAGYAVNDGKVIQTSTMTVFRGDTNVWISMRMAPRHHLLFGGTYNRLDYRRFNFQSKDALVAADPDLVISEETTEFIGEIGYEYTSFFDGTGTGIKYQAKVIAGLPVYTHVRNTALDGDDAFTESMNGYNLRSELGLGYQFSKNVMVAAVVDMGYQSRDEQSRKGKDGKTQILPDRTFGYFQPSFNFIWSF